MCLISQDKETKAASEDITCWKMVKIGSDNQVMTPYTDTPIPESAMCGKKPFKAEHGTGSGDRIRYNVHPPLLPNGRLLKHNAGWEYGIGFVHTYADQMDALIEASGHHMWEIYKCVIPKGARYAEGFDLYDRPGYASERIVFVEKTY